MEKLYDQRKLSINDIELDRDNPRVQDIGDQNKIINYLLAKEGAAELALDIADKDSLNPLDNIAVMSEGKTFVVLEGNRRCAAIKALNNPQIIENQTIRTKLSRAIAESGYQPIVEIDCIEFNSREDANEFIRIRHGGLAGGVGLKSWDPTQNERFRIRNNFKPLYALATELMDWALDRGVIDSETRAKLAITNIERMVKSPAVKAKLGLIVGENGKLFSNHPVDWFASFLGELIRRERLPSGHDDRIDARKAYRKSDRERIANQIVESVRSAGVVDTFLETPCPLDSLGLEANDEAGSESHAQERAEHGGEEFDSQRHESFERNDAGEFNRDAEREDEENAGVDEGNDTSTQRPPRVPDPARRFKIFSSDFKPHINNKVTAKLFREMKSIDVREYPTSSLFLIRAFLESIFGQFCKAKGIDSNPQLELRKKISKTCDYLLDSGNGFDSKAKSEANGLKTLKTISSDETKVLSPNRINNVIHGGTHAPTHSEITAAWDGIEAEVLFVTDVLWPR